MMMKGEGEGKGAVMFGGIVVGLLLLFAQADLFALVEGVLFTNADAAVYQPNVSGGWAEAGVIGIYFFIIIFAIVVVIFMLIGRGGLT